jgi:low temperature requirement protein LtrA
MLVTGFVFADTESTAASIIAFVTAFATAAAAWWIYFDHGERVGAEAIESSDTPGRLARTAYTWMHLPIVAGIVVISVGDKDALSHPHAHDPAAAIAVIGGPMLFLAGTVLFRHLLERRWARAQLAGLLALALLAVAAIVLDTLTLSIGTAVVLAGVAAGETVGRLRRGRRSGG